MATVGSGSQRPVNVGRHERNASMAGGASLALSGLRKLGQRKLVPGLAMILTGGLLFYRGRTGHCTMYSAMGMNTAGTEDNSLMIREVVTISRAPMEVYEYWRDFGNLPRFMRHLDSVAVTGPMTSHWVARAPGGVTVEWDAEMVEDLPGRRIGWRAEEKADIPNEGKVEFAEAPGGRGTEVRVMVHYCLPAGTAGKLAAKAVLGLNAQEIREDLRRLKQIMETGETATQARVRKE